MSKAVISANPASRLATNNLRKGRFSFWFSKIGRALSQQMALHVRRECGLNLAGYRILTMLAECNSASIRDIAADIDLDKAQVTRAIANLTKRGLTIHTVDKRDRRLRVVKLTPAGQKLFASIIPFSAARQERLERCLTTADLRVLWKALAVLSDETNKMLAEEARE
jgi:DNA-binding MarR family transcriptional regulator